MSYWQIFFFATLAGLSGCAAPLHTEVVEPPKSPAVSRLRHVAIFPFTGPSGEQITSEVESLLAQATEHGQPFFVVVDRRTLQHAVDELSLHKTGLVDSRTASRVGKFVGAEGIYVGSVYIPPITRQTSLQDRYACSGVLHPARIFSGCANMAKTTVSCINKVAQFTIVPRLIAVATAQIVYQPTITGQAQGSSCSDTGGEVDDHTLVGQAATQALNKLRDDVTPHVRVLDLVLKTDMANLDEPSRTRFGNAMAFAHADRMDRACTTWRELQSENRASVTLAFDVAVCEENDGHLDTAMRDLDALDQLLQQPDADVNAARKRLQSEIEAQQAAQAPVQTGNGPIIRSGSGRRTTAANP